MNRPNSYPGTCIRCDITVAANAGVLLRVDGRSAVLCPLHAPPAQRPVIQLSLVDNRVTLRPVGFLGPDLFQQFRAATAGTATYDRDRKISLAPIAQVSTLASRLAAAGFAVQSTPEVDAAVAVRDAHDAQHQSAAGQRAQQIDDLLHASGGALMPFQRDGVAWLASQTGAVLADEMGLGKTIQVLISAPNDQGILVVCPKVAKSVWRREAARWRPDLQVTVLEGRGSFRWPEPGQLLITNYDVLPSPEACVTIAASAPAATLVADEAHMLKSGAGKRGSQRSRAFAQLSDAVRACGGRTWLVTGSPLLNDPPELWALLRMVGQTGAVFGTYDQFRTLCGGHVGTYGTTWSGKVASEVPSRLRRAMLRRLKRDVAPQLPEKLVEIIDVELDTQTQRKADAISTQLAKAGVDLTSAVEVLRQSSSQSPEFEQLSKLRALLAQAKLGHALELVTELEDAGEPVIVMSAHRATIDAFADRAGWAVITGDTSDADRGQIADQFQAGQLRGVAGTLQAMGVAITLTRAHEAIIIDPLLVPDLNRQGEDRIHRIGQDHRVRIRYLCADHPIDRRAFEICQIKRSLAERSIDAAAVQVGEVATRASHAAQLAAAALDAESEAQARQLADLIAEIRAQHAAGATQQTRTRAARKAAQVIQSRGYAIAAADLATPPRPARDEREAWAAAALCQLASSCDGAVTRDESGFSKPDSFVGKALADAVTHGLTEAEWQLAQQICQRYPRQVGRPAALARAADQ